MRRPASLFSSFLLLSSLVLPAKEVVAQDTESVYEAAECPFEGADRIEGLECGYLTVPEDRTRPNGRTLRLAVAILRSTGDAPAPDPLVFLAGGPGGKSVEFTPERTGGSFWDLHRRQRDLVFYDQRGAGYSDPNFCPEWDEFEATMAMGGLSQEEVGAMSVATARACREKVLAEGLDFSAYNSATSARDLTDLRRALGYERWNLLGASYGTRLALTAMRDTPEGIRSVILDSTDPPNARLAVDAPWRLTRSLKLLFDQCKADEACRGAFPTLEEDFYAVLDSLEERPVALTMTDTTRFPEGRIVIDGRVFASGVFQGLYDRYFIPVLPLAIRETRAGNADVLTALADGIAQDPHRISVGLNKAIECYERVPFNPPEMIEAERARYPRLHAWYAPAGADVAVCDAWHDERADSIEIAPVESDIPTLILAGEFDPVTPPAYGRLAAETLPNSTFIEARGLGHGVAPVTDCTTDLTAAFLDDPTAPLDTGCTEELPPVEFVTDVHITGGVYRLASWLQNGPNPALLVVPGLIVLLLLSAVLAWPVGYLIRRLRHRPPATTSMQRGARWLAWTNCLVALGFLGGLAAVVMRTAADNPFVLAFGVPGDVGWMFLLPWLVLLLTPGAAVLAFFSWRREWWALPARLHYSLVVVACLGFVLLVSGSGLM